MLSHLESFLGSVCFQPCQVQHVFITSMMFTCDYDKWWAHLQCLQSQEQRVSVFIAFLNFSSFLPVAF